MKRSRWLLAVLSSAALALIPGTAPSAGTPGGAARAVTLVDDASPGTDGNRSGPGGRPTARAEHRPRTPQPPPDAPGLCRPGLPPDAPQTTRFYDDNRLLGPAVLPTESPVGPLLAGYRRFGAQTEAQWVGNYTVNGAGTALVFPPENGFFLGPDGKPVKQRQTMLPGYRLDRFGFTGGSFLAPLGTPFNSRSLAPQSLNTPPTPPATTPAAPLANYHTYCVLTPFDVDSGPIAPWFAQPGMGTQFQLNPAYVPEAGKLLTVQWLLDHHVIVEEYLGGSTPPCAADAVPRQGGRGGGLRTAPVC